MMLEGFAEGGFRFVTDAAGEFAEVERFGLQII